MGTRLHTFASVCWEVVLGPVLTNANIHRNLTLTLGLVLWLAVGCRAPPQSRRGVVYGAIAVSLAVAVLKLVKVCACPTFQALHLPMPPSWAGTL